MLCESEKVTLIGFFKGTLMQIQKFHYMFRFI